MTRLETGAAVLAATGIPLLVACSGGSRPEAPRRHVVEIRAMAFEPKTIEIRPGDTVVWVNRDLVPHTATATDAAWTSPELGPGDEWATAAIAEGAQDYLCAYHSDMRGSVEVVPGGGS